MENQLVSIVIPYFNAGKFIKESLSSALSQTYENIEVVMIDDGSTDDFSINLFDEIEHPKLRKFRTTNQGPSIARNTAISMAYGSIILPLDSDDLISNTYVEKALLEFQKNPNLGIVYSEAKIFGDVEGLWPLPEYELVDFLTENCIFNAAFFKKSDWKLAGGYKSDMENGLEDYDFWLSIISLNREVMRLPSIHFFYRKHGTSQVSKLTESSVEKMYDLIIMRHRELYINNISNLIKRINTQKRKIRDLTA